ncbi:hypothetical protein BO71DRAFT_442028 [Aspergillus ellipticus CBS 707.79]|uniref:RING-type domain-containing protein n=1 Tax=Aspergillus ellipticus CBS 707.79 TaxID=1448320 RepID=A0A319D775_9EURO|nr:hypothetical protein BO71DRAFT_442028 [Aspergillus ellipticus CBS 707.79]
MAVFIRKSIDRVNHLITMSLESITPSKIKNAFQAPHEHNTRFQATLKEPHPCIACGTTTARGLLFKAPCREGHYYCKPCLSRFFETTLVPKCCGIAIRAQEIRLFMGGEFRKKTRLARARLAGKNPTLCYNCETYLAAPKPSSLKARCLACRKWTCPICRKHGHKWRHSDAEIESQKCRTCDGWKHRGPCPDGTDKLLTLIKASGWKRLVGVTMFAVRAEQTYVIAVVTSTANVGM